MNKFEKQPVEKEGGQEKIKWKEWRVGVMGASSNENKEAIKNGYEIGKLLAEDGYDAINGGHDVGGMGSTAKGYQEACKKDGLKDKEIEKHFIASVMSENMVGKKLASDRQYIKPAKRIESGSLSERMGNIINNSDATIVLPGGTGTHMEALVAAQDEWFREKRSRSEQEAMQHKPIIIVDNNNTLAKMVAVAENDSPKTLNTLTHRVFIINSETGETLDNSPTMQEKIKAILNFYYLDSLDNPSNGQKEIKRKILKQVRSGNMSFDRFRTVVKEYQEKFNNLK